MKNFVIVGTQRTGSSALADVISAHKDIACGWEWTVRSPLLKKISSAKQALGGDFSRLLPKHQKHMATVYRDDLAWLGYRRLFRSSRLWFGHPSISPALWVDRLNAHLAWFASSPDLHIIHIVRRDNVGWLTSKALSKTTGKYIGAYGADAAAKINPTEAVKMLTAKNYLDNKLVQLKASNPYLQVAYEDFKADNALVGKKVFQFFNCDDEGLLASQPQVKVQSSKDVRESVENYDQLLQILESNNLVVADVSV